MAATITAAAVAPVLREAADLVAGLPYARVVRTDIHRALRQAGQYETARAALGALHRYLRTVGRLPMLTHWAKPTSRDEVAAELRAAADVVEAEPEQPPMTSPAYPEPGSEIPNQPGYVVATCRHRVAASEWRAGFRTCERCPAAELASAEEGL